MVHKILAYVGTYTGGDSKGIYVCRYDPATGALDAPALAAQTVNPSFLAIDARRRYLYATSEIGDFAGQRTGAISAFAIDRDTGQLALLNQQPSGGGGPAYVAIEQSERYVLAANYGGGSVGMLPIREDGSLGEPSDVVQHEGSSANPRRQEQAHCHAVIVSPDNRFALVADLGIDKIMVYQLDLERGKLRPNDPPWAQVAAGSGPRHMAFHPSERYLYLINELSSTITVFAYDGARGALSELQTISTLPPGFNGINWTADLHVAPSGRFLYGSNRGHDSIAVFAIDPDTGKLETVEHTPTQGHTPRNFTLAPGGTYLLAANQESDNVVTFRVDPDTGRLTPTGSTIRIPRPVCVQLVTFA